ncbi:MAG: DbpA RNA binding domain-containing protein [Spirochaetaceae bacterium]|jgi:hypothetical protein|nr:DbpA RNA binding domain-containing protein [Spirochaetaceae bacterium]
MSSQFNKERTIKNIKIILEKIHTEVDPFLLNAYRSLMKKEVSFFRRSHVAAYLLMRLDQGSGGKRRGAEKSAPRDESRIEPNRYLPEEESARLFISIGRNRRVFPREILGLINAKTSVAKDDIGTIRILDNYSFIQVRTTAADEIIEALNGISFRGRTLSVNYARNRRDEPGDSQERLPQQEDDHTDEETV